MGDSTSAPPRFPAPRRVSTAPVAQSESARASSPSPLGEGIIETLYSHPNAKIISFSASGRALSRSGLPGDDAPGSLSWSSQLERTIAVGPFRIYRATGSVAFLNCGSALQPILPKSQCWCIDEINSKFVLQIRRPQYWRIELPVADPEDQDRAEALREVLGKILQFEKTICPFKRTFIVELPEGPEGPVIKKPWTPVLRSPPVTPVIDAASPVSPILARRASIIPPAATLTSLSNERHREVPENPPASRPESSSQSPFVPLRVGELENRIDIENAERLEAFNGSGNLFDRTWDMEGPQHQQDPKAPRQRDDGSELPYPDYDPSTEHQYNIVSHRLADIPQSPQQDGTESRRPLLKPLLVPSTSPDAQHHTSLSNLTTPRRYSSEMYHESSPAIEPQPLDISKSGYELHEGTGSHKDRMKTRLRMARSTTMPSHVKLATDSSTELDTSHHVPLQGRKESSSGDTSRVEEQRPRRRGSEDSFHSVQSSLSPSTPTLPHSPEAHGTITAGKDSVDNDIASHGEDISETRSGWETGSDGGSVASHESVTTDPDDLPLKMVGAFPTSTTPDAVEESPAPVTRPRRSTASHRATTSSISVRGGPLSPLPSAANLFTPAQMRRPYQSKLDAVKRIPMAIITKTLEMILGPPSYLINLMLRVAAKILAGEWRGLVTGYNDDGEEIPVQWDYSEGELSDWSDDEPYMGPRRGRQPHHRRHSRAKHGKGTADESPESPESPVSTKSSRSWGVD